MTGRISDYKNDMDLLCRPEFRPQDTHADCQDPQREQERNPWPVRNASNSMTAQPNPEKATQRGSIRVRDMIVQVEKVNTPAILIANTFRNAPASSLAT